MESVAEQEMTLFGDELPSLEQISELSQLVHSSESRQNAFAEQVEANIRRTGEQAVLAVGIGLYILGRAEEAIGKLEKAPDGKEKFVYLALAQRRSGRYDEAVDSLQKSLGFGAEPLFVCLEKAATYRGAGDYEAAGKEIESCANYENVSAEYHMQRGRLLEVQGAYTQAVEQYKKAVEVAPRHARALFHLAYRCDLLGDEEAAIDYYKQITAESPVYVSALLNLAVLYEDMGDYDKASLCAAKVLESHPNHQRAILFMKDIDSSKTMYYDEERERRRTRKNQTLETPISDFELSVRSRNCLRRMNIRTLGDLLHITEAELLAYKNFGETSLQEIKAILDSKNLHLGMALEEQQYSADEVAEAETMEDQGLLNKPADDLQLSVRSKKCLQRLGLRTLGDLTRTTEAELLGCKNFGVTSLNEIKKALGALGLSLRNLD